MVYGSEGYIIVGLIFDHSQPLGSFVHREQQKHVVDNDYSRCPSLISNVFNSQCESSHLTSYNPSAQNHKNNIYTS